MNEKTVKVCKKCGDYECQCAETQRALIIELERKIELLAQLHNLRETGVTFCHKCGRPVEFHPYVPGVEDDAI